MLARHRKINRRWGKDEITPLHLAVYSGSLDTIRLLLTCGADATSESSQGTPLHYAVQYSTVEVFRLLSNSKRGRKLYRKEAKQYNKNSSREHLRHRSLLELAAERGWEDLCLELVQHHNYNVEWGTQFTKRLICVALMHGHLSLAK